MVRAIGRMIVKARLKQRYIIGGNLFQPAVIFQPALTFIVSSQKQNKNSNPLLQRDQPKTAAQIVFAALLDAFFAVLG